MKRSLTLFLFFLIARLCFAQVTNYWDKRFGGNAVDDATGFERTFDGGFVIAGHSYSNAGCEKSQNSQGSADYWLVKTDAAGNLQWEKSYGGSGYDSFARVKQTADSGYIIAGTSYSGISGDKTQAAQGSCDYWIIKTDQQGNVIWDRTFGGSGADVITDIVAVPGGYLAVGYSYSPVSGNKTLANWDGTLNSADVWLVKMDLAGNFVWDRVMGGTDEDRPSDALSLGSRGYIISGFARSGVSGNKTSGNWNAGNYDIWVMRTDTMGNLVWDKNYGGTQDEWQSNRVPIVKIPGNSFVVGCATASIDGDVTAAQIAWADFWMFKIDSMGTMQWDRKFGGLAYEDEIGTITFTSDGGFLLCGTSYSGIGGDKTQTNLGSEATWIVKTNAAGIRQWDYTVQTGNFQDIEVSYAYETSPGCYVIANCNDAGIGGDKTSADCYDWDLWMVKLCNETTGEPDAVGNSTVNVYPDPFAGSFFIALKDGADSEALFELYDVFGRKVRSEEVKRSAEIQRKELSSGIYFYRVSSEGKIISSGKIIAE